MISLDKVSKYYNQVPVVNELTLDIPQGQMFGLLGPNGAGKSTTIRILTTLTHPSQGKVTVAGYDVVKQAPQVKRHIGVVLQQTSVDPDLTVWENMEYHGRLHHIPQPDRQKLIQQWLEYVELHDRQTVMVRTLSGGMKRRLQIARALVHQPQILFMDEPTVGLDPQTRRRLWEIIRDLNGKGMTILLTTHYMAEAEFLCDRIGIMNSGQIIEMGSPDQLREKYGKAVLIHQSPEGLVTKFFPDLTSAEAFLAQQPDKRGMMIRDSNLEDIFVELTGRQLD
jgi:ABC-2 type transport system ATP-binding protein